MFVLLPNTLSLQVLTLVITNRKKVAFYILCDAIIFSVHCMFIDRGGPLLSQLPVSLAELPMPPSLEPKLHKKVCVCVCVGGGGGGGGRGRKKREQEAEAGKGEERER